MLKNLAGLYILRHNVFIFLFKQAKTNYETLLEEYKSSITLYFTYQLK